MVKATVLQDVLECSSLGDCRFSALYAKVTIRGETKTIEEWWQMSKNWERLGVPIKPKNWRESKKMKYSSANTVASFTVLDKIIPSRLGSDWYSLLWALYFQQNQHLLEVISHYKRFHDVFKTKDTMVCQADVIAKINQMGLEDFVESLADLINLLQD